MFNSIYKMYHGDIRELMRSQANYREHLFKIADQNRKARENHGLVEKSDVKKAFESLLEIQIEVLQNTECGEGIAKSHNDWAIFQLRLVLSKIKDIK